MKVQRKVPLEAATRQETKVEVIRTFRFAGKFVLALLGSIVGLRLGWALFSFSRWTRLVLLALVASILYATAPRWVRWLPGLLVFGIINSLVGLVTHHAPTNPRVEVSAGVAWMLIAFYSVGCVVSRYYDTTRLSVVDRVALLVYLFCMIWPAFVSNDLAAVNPTVAWSVSVGMAALIVSFAAHRTRGAKNS